MTSPISLTGLSSGFDWGSLIDQLIQADSAPVTQMQQQQSQITTQQSDWNNLSQKLNTLSSALQAYSSLTIDSTFNVQSVTSGNQNLVTASVATDSNGNIISPANGAYTLSNIVLAKPASILSTTSNGTFQSGLYNFKIINNEYLASSHSTISVTATITVNASSLGDVANAINKVTSANVSATVINNKLIITDNYTGHVNSIAITNTANNSLVAGLGLTAAGTRAGTDGSFNVTYNGIITSVTTYSNTVNNAINGLTINLLNNVTSASVTITVANDASKVMSGIQTMVNDYNDVMDYINQLYYGTASKTVSAMASSSAAQTYGALNGDFTLVNIQSTLLSKMQQDFSGRTGVVNQYNTLRSIGISTDDASDSMGFNEEGKMSIDTTQLQQALTSNPQAVKALLQQLSSDLTDLSSGYITNLVSTTANGQGLIPTVVQSLQNNYNDLSDQIQALQDNLTQERNMLTQQFTAMEQAMAQAKAQSNWFAQQMAALPAG
ncbi:flagellar filament capping protein FliD [Desulfotomaculum copahuensis]|uniref:Flagellar hook-associated protein 2 n=1 Tax=Desulfotomaculum copahuensis TaxID=1838280 RepID=A0A1B7LCH1_9FIRM|nr:flagellar filament capping protein FliD [Desulfotomaculum copahuensis]OAT80381.1 hypothetical protein A6M21_13515 [Desulfotomaculum copahuensis]